MPNLLVSVGTHTPQHCSGTSSVVLRFSQKESHGPCISRSCWRSTKPRGVECDSLRAKIDELRRSIDRCLAARRPQRYELQFRPAGKPNHVRTRRNPRRGPPTSGDLRLVGHPYGARINPVTCSMKNTGHSEGSLVCRAAVEWLPSPPGRERSWCWTVPEMAMAGDIPR
jgi:hypothetical protein